ncbi:hypothetical protein Hanom_Chr09g00809351 [Helianthus anomalus]
MCCNLGFGGFFKGKMVMHMVVVTLALGFFQKNDFFTFHPKVFHKLLLTKTICFFFYFRHKTF